MSIKNREALRPRAYSRRALVLWELVWTSVEMTCVAAGLLLLLMTRFDELGGFVLFATLGLSFFVRLRHYVTVGRARQWGLGGR